MKRIFLFLLSIGLVGTSLAQEESFSFTLQEAQEYALEHNKTFLNAQSDIALAEEKYKEARGSGLPQVNGAMDYTTNFNYEFEFAFGGGGDVDPDVVNQALQQTMADYPNWTMEDVMDYQASQAFEQTLQSIMPASTIVMEDQANASIQVSQLIFSGQYWVGLQMAKLSREIAEKSLTASKNDLKENVANLYYGILASQKFLQIIDHILENNRDILEQMQNMYEKGMVEEIEVDQIHMGISELENSKKSMQRSLEYSINTFRFVLGIETTARIEFRDDLNEFLEEVVEENLLASSFNIDNNPTFQLMEMQEKIGEKGIAMQKWTYAPTVSGFYSYREKILKSSFDLSPKNTAGLTLNVPIISGGTRSAQLSQAKIEYEKINRNKELLEEQLELQNRQLIYELKNALDNYQVQKENVAVAKRVYDNSNNKYKHGQLSVVELNQTRNNYLQAENNYVSSILNLLQAKLKKDKLYNNL
ncbi:MAG: TolC family protein [Bacteroidales bacterium]|jgi:outer membrane protein TolC|nr:TolC family protein [Bacteroidales bacterium]